MKHDQAELTLKLFIEMCREDPIPEPIFPFPAPFFVRKHDLQGPVRIDFCTSYWATNPPTVYDN